MQVGGQVAPSSPAWFSKTIAWCDPVSGLRTVDVDCEQPQQQVCPGGVEDDEGPSRLALLHVVHQMVQICRPHQNLQNIHTQHGLGFQGRAYEFRNGDKPKFWESRVEGLGLG